MIRINVGGVIFHTLRRTLENAGGLLKNVVLHPETFARDPYHDNIVFLDRNPKKFEEILDMCRNNGRPLREKIPMRLLDEIEYFNITTRIPFRFEAGDQINLKVDGVENIAWITEITLHDISMKTREWSIVRCAHTDVWTGTEFLLHR